MKKFNRFLSLFLLLATLLCCLGSCEFFEDLFGTKQPVEWVDYASQLKLDLDSPTLKWEVEVKQHIDGDTTHFYINEEGNINNINKTPGIDGILKARYLGVNTPESTGKIEPWGKKASNFTKERLESAESIIIESDDTNWNLDSTGQRFLVWVWYKPEGATDYKNLNLEILQEGLAWSSKAGTFTYSDYCLKAVQQAYEAKHYVYAPPTELDPDFPYGDAQFMTLKELKLNIKDYIGQRVAFEGVIVKDSGGSIYIESYDEVDGVHYGISAYYLTSGLDGDGLAMLKIGNKIRFAGVVGEFGGSYQITDLKYDIWNPDDSKNMVLISENNPVSYQEVTGDYFFNGKVTIEINDDEDVASKDFYFKEIAQDASVSMKDLRVIDVYTTKKGNSKGAISVTCKTPDNKTIVIRTIVLYDDKGVLVTEDIFEGKTIDVKGTIDYYVPDGQTVGTYQIMLHSIDDVTFHD